MPKKKAIPKKKSKKKAKTSMQVAEQKPAYASDALKSLDEISQNKKEDTSADGSSKPDLMLEKEDKMEQKQSTMVPDVIETNSDHKEIMKHVKSIDHIVKWTLALVFIILIILVYTMLQSF